MHQLPGDDLFYIWKGVRVILYGNNRFTKEGQKVTFMYGVPSNAIGRHKTSSSLVQVPIRRKAIPGTNAELLSTEPLWTNFNGNLIKNTVIVIQENSFEKSTIFHVSMYVLKTLRADKNGYSWIKYHFECILSEVFKVWFLLFYPEHVCFVDFKTSSSLYETKQIKSLWQTLNMWPKTTIPFLVLFLFFNIGSPCQERWPTATFRKLIIVFLWRIGLPHGKRSIFFSLNNHPSGSHWRRYLPH